MKRPPAKDLIAALEAARRHIENGSNYVCRALTRAHYQGDATHAATQYLRRYIAKNLGPANGTLEEWINRQPVHPVVRSYRQARLQWIDWMIVSIKETG